MNHLHKHVDWPICNSILFGASMLCMRKLDLYNLSRYAPLRGNDQNIIFYCQIVFVFDVVFKVRCIHITDLCRAGINVSSLSLSQRQCECLPVRSLGASPSLPGRLFGFLKVAYFDSCIFLRLQSVGQLVSSIVIREIPKCVVV